jgi:cytochrome b561
MTGSMDSRQHQSVGSYDPTTIMLHWCTAALVLALWIIGQTADWLPKGPVTSYYWSSHILLGFALVVLLAWRIIWRFSAGRRLPPYDSGILQFAAETTHYGLYGLLIIVLAFGIANAFVRGYNLFDIVRLPQWGDASLRRPITHWHGLIANILLGLAFLHATAALIHFYISRDAVLRRMLPRAR